ncbi:hypothetical protein [Streptomyces scabiei]|nr:hypothetical protein [Streptomyces scabiei]MDX3520165.1 hypothetical protein [Streptomyces scabiei]
MSLRTAPTMNRSAYSVNRPADRPEAEHLLALSTTVLPGIPGAAVEV